jgi:hypothetical protein
MGDRLLASDDGLGVKGFGFEVPSLKCGDWVWHMGYGRWEMGQDLVLVC